MEKNLKAIKDLSARLIQTNEQVQTPKQKIKKKDSCCQRMCHKIFPFFASIDRKSNRIIYINENFENGKNKNSTPFSNKLNNQKYSIFTFLPVVLFNQFSYFSNQFYLLMVISQFFDVLKVGFLFSYVAPLIIVLIITLFKEAYDDYYRYVQDKKFNNHEYIVYKKNFSTNKISKENVKSEDLKVGDIVEINKNEIVPADVILLKTCDSSGSVFIRTDQLDGETDWKLRKAPFSTQMLKNFEDIYSIKAYIETTPPEKNIYDYKGCLNLIDYNKGHLSKSCKSTSKQEKSKKTKLAAGYTVAKLDDSYLKENIEHDFNTESYKNYLGRISKLSNQEQPGVNIIQINNLNNTKASNNEKKQKNNNSTYNECENSDSSKEIQGENKLLKESLSLENTMWSSTVLASNKALGIIIFTGRETRSKMNSSNPRTKKGKLDLELNLISKILFIIMIALALVITFLKGFRLNLNLMLLDFFRFIVLLCAIIPISLATNLDISKAINTYKINNDKQIDQTIARNSTIPEELGRISYIFSDKTGTLTQNDMEFKKLILADKEFLKNNSEEIGEIIKNQCIIEERVSKECSSMRNNHQQHLDNFRDFSQKNKFELDQYKEKYLDKGLDIPVSNILESELSDEKNKNNSLHQHEKLENDELNNNFNININPPQLRSNTILPLISKQKPKDYKKTLHQIITVMALCNNVTPIYEDYKSFSQLESVEVDKSNEKISEKDIKEIKSYIDFIKNTEQMQVENEKSEINEDRKEPTKNIIETKDSDITYNSSKEGENFLENINRQINYQASSPDEIALVKAAFDMNTKLIYRDDYKIKILNANNKIDEFEILANFPFSSDKKRMGILLRNKLNKKISFYVKGAESELVKIINKKYSMIINENTENLATEGLRTLVFAQKDISEDFYLDWEKKYKTAKATLESRNEKIDKVMNMLESDMEFLGITGVEDLLQENVEDSIEAIRNAGIKFWVLTGDKLETSISVGKAAHIIQKRDRLLIISENDFINLNHSKLLENVGYSKSFCDKSHVENYVNYVKDKINFVLNTTSGINTIIIDGKCLDIAMEYSEKEFFQITYTVSTVICCRCSPTQKAKIVKLIKKFSQNVTASIGDGGNDVPMIQEADVGIGIVGKEGLQASLAADFSTTKFKNIIRLIFWQGRLSYKNTATVAKFVIHRGLIISLIQFIFSIMFYNLSVPIFNGWLILGYSSVYTSLPVISLLMDKDSRIDDIMKFPVLYKSVLKGRELSAKSFFIWLFKSIFQAAIIMIGSMLIFEDKIYLKIVTVVFSVLIIAELLNVYLEIKTLHRYMFISLLFTLLTYFFSLYLLNSILNVYVLNDISSILSIFFLSFISWLPFRIYQYFENKYYAEVVDKIKNMDKRKSSFFI